MNVLQELFGPSREVIWRQLADALGGSYDERLFTGSIVLAKHEQWTIALDTIAIEKVEHTRLRAPFLNRGLRFEIHAATYDFWQQTGLAPSDIKIGDEAFDAEWVIRGNDEARIQQLLGNQEIRDLIAVHKNVQLGVREDQGKLWRNYPEGVEELYLHLPKVVTDLELLKALFYLFSEVLDELCRLDLASPKGPGVSL
jgi:hypothetical protein